MARKINGVTVYATLRGRDVQVIFQSPYRWQVLENGNDVTDDFGGIIDRDTPALQAWHDEVTHGTKRQRLDVAW